MLRCVISGDSAHDHQLMRQDMPAETDCTPVNADRADCALFEFLLR